MSGIFDLFAGSGIIKVGTVDDENEILTFETVAICLGPDRDCKIEARDVSGQVELFFVRPDQSEVQIT